ncbi:hypothetical protein ACIGMX_12525 [Streptomyces aquilus]|uniref:hypothetical protein n=1 Tax=Streptomyces aquilus TaxID=2548456 RepID=UPI0037D1A4D1
MATIRVLQAVSGLDFSWAPGELVDLDDEQAATWADGVRAELVDEHAIKDAAVPSTVQHQPVVTDEDGRQLEIVAATCEEITPPDGAPEGSTWVQWAVTVRLSATNPDPDEDGDVFDPADHSVKDVLAYLEDADEQEAQRVLQAEENAPTPRKGIIAERDAILARARARAAAGAGAPETTAEASRGGGRGEGIETR